MVGLLQLKLPTSTPAGFLINGLIMNLLQRIFSQAENLVFQIPKSRGRIFLCVSPTFASPIEKPATSAPQRICREIIANTEENAKTVDSLQRCKWTSSASKSAPKTKKTDQRSGRRRIEKWSGWWGSNPRLSAPKADALSHCATPRFLWRFYTITPDFAIVKAENRESMLFLPFSTVEAKCQFQNRVNPQHLFRNLMRIQHQLRP